MLRFHVQDAAGKSIIGLGLTDTNIERMRAGEPVLVKVAELEIDGPADNVEFLIYVGKDEQALRQELEDAGLIGPETREIIDPRLT